MSPADDPANTFNLRTIGPEPDGATPLEEEDLVDLIPAFVATRGDLHIVEFDNITKAMPWALDQARRRGAALVLGSTFPNGNGRCTRLVADLYLTAIDQPIFTWGADGKLDEDGEARQRYIDALYAADGDDYAPLVAFARS